MNLKIKSDGNFDFALIENPEKRIVEFDLNKLFYMRKGAREEKIMTKKEFESALRFVDTDDYLDTLIVEPKVLRNVDKLLELFDFITSEAAFKVPCMVYWDSNLKKWMQEYPAWHRQSQFFSLAHWACAALERGVWLKFFTMNNMDPRGPGESTSFISESKILNSVEIIQSLPEFLRSLGRSSKEDLIGDHLSIKTIFDDVKEKLRNFKSDNFGHREVCFIPNQIDSFKNYKDSNAIENFLNIVKNFSEEVLVECLLCTPLDRTLTAFDLTLRIISLRVKEMYTKKMAEELMNEGNEEAKKSKKTKKRRKKNKNKEIVDESHGNGMDFTKDLVKNIMKGMYEFIESKEKAEGNTAVKVDQDVNSCEFEKEKIELKDSVSLSNHIIIDDAEFKIVNQKKKPRKNQQDFKNYQINNRPKPANRQPARKPLTPPPSQKTSKQTSKSSWQTPIHPIKSSVDPIAFPPLFSSFNQNSSLLHQEIIRFVSSHLSILSKKYQALSLIRDQIKSLVERHFAGSLFVYGSYATGLAVEESDIDLAVSCQEELSREEVIKNCLYLSEVLSDEDFVKSISPIITASVPLVKIEANLCPRESIPIIGSIDITFVNKADTGDSLLKVNEFMKELQRNWPQLHPLALFLKAFLYHHGLNSVYSGKI
jgi:predicted nucleotidyltransferase